ncbi:hypothetical protein IMSAGC013_00811 [Lachnospiraceae bacterium]|nr:hypothetical protein IMSAGC013_00811 [Lachnospiraceae bacterium]
MNTILQQLYNGEICLTEQYRPILEEYQAIRKKHMDNYKSFIEKLGSPLDKPQQFSHHGLPHSRPCCRVVFSSLILLLIFHFST